MEIRIKEGHPAQRTAPKRVAAYCRVSMNSESLLHSLSAQISYYSTLIKDNPEWTYAGVYSDEGITGTSMKKREGFRQLMADCDAGKIDIVLAKSISRWARNTVDLLTTVRHLREHGIEVRFERERINTLSCDGEFLLTVLASYAEEESRSISMNVRWSIRKKFAEGIPNGHRDPYGYKWDGEMFRIIPDEGKTVKRIFSEFAGGCSAYSIASGLRSDGIDISQSHVMDIIGNESYTGIMTLQKYYLSEEHRKRRNTGELARYRVSGMFEPLISAEMYENVSEIRKQRAACIPKADITPFSGKVRCGICGHGVSRRTTRYGKVWKCNERERNGKDRCGLMTVTEKELTDAATEALAPETYSSENVEKHIKGIMIFNDCLVFRMSTGRNRKVMRKYGVYSHMSGFSGKIICGKCGNVMQADRNRKMKIWECRKCDAHPVKDEEIRKAAESILGADCEAKFAAEADKAEIYEDRLELFFSDGRRVTWKRK